MIKDKIIAQICLKLLKLPLSYLFPLWWANRIKNEFIPVTEAVLMRGTLSVIASSVFTTQESSIYPLMTSHRPANSY